MTDGPVPPRYGRQDPDPAISEGQRIAEVEDLLADLDNTPLQDMTPLFYQHAFGELAAAVRDLVEILHHRTED